MKKKIIYKHSYVIFTTNLSNTIIDKDGVEQWESYTLIEDIVIDKRDSFKPTFYKLLDHVIQTIFDSGDIFVRLYLKKKNEDVLDDYIFSIVEYGFKQISMTQYGRMFVLIKS